MKHKPFANARAHAHGVIFATRRGYFAIRYGQDQPAETAGGSSTPRVQTSATTLGDIWEKSVVKKPAK